MNFIVTPPMGLQVFTASTKQKTTLPCHCKFQRNLQKRSSSKACTERIEATWRRLWQPSRRYLSCSPEFCPGSRLPSCESFHCPFDRKRSKWPSHRRKLSGLEVSLCTCVNTKQNFNKVTLCHVGYCFSPPIFCLIKAQIQKLYKHNNKDNKGSR